MDFIDKHIDAQVEAYKANRYKNSNSKGMYFIQRLFKRNYNENHQSVSSANQKGLQGHRTLEIQETSDSINQRN